MRSCVGSAAAKKLSGDTHHGGGLRAPSVFFAGPASSFLAGAVPVLQLCFEVRYVRQIIPNRETL